MLKLIENEEIYVPEPIRIRSILLGGGQDSKDVESQFKSELSDSGLAPRPDDKKSGTFSI